MLHASLANPPNVAFRWVIGRPPRRTAQFAVEHSIPCQNIEPGMERLDIKTSRHLTGCWEIGNGRKGVILLSKGDITFLGSVPQLT
jgi:hypothetical protein